MDVRFAHPFTCVVSGPTGGGKTEFAAELIENISDMMVPVPENTVWCYGEWQKCFEKSEMLSSLRVLHRKILLTGEKKGW